jgi:putative transcriptional regulator
MKNHIKSLRAKNDLSQQKLAELLGVSRQTIHMIELGKYNASLDLAFKLANLFNEKIENIFIREEPTVFYSHHTRSYR